MNFLKIELNKTGIIYQCFQGFVQVTTEDVSGKGRVDQQPFFYLSLGITRI